MSKYTVFVDEDGSELRSYKNDEGKCFIECGDLMGDGYYSGHIALDRDDLKELIAVLNNILNVM